MQPKAMKAAFLVVVLAAVLGPPSSLAQEPPAVVGEVEVTLHVTPSGNMTPPDGTVGQAVVHVTVRCVDAVVMTEPIEIALAYTGSGAAFNVTFDPEVVSWEWQDPVCTDGSTGGIDATVSFEVAPVDAMRALVPMSVEASSDAMVNDTATVEWNELMGFFGTVSASLTPSVPVKTDARNEFAVRVENDANEGLTYVMTLVDGLSLVDAAEDVWIYPGLRVVHSRYERGFDNVDFAVVEMVPSKVGEANLTVRLTFEDPRNSSLVFQEITLTTLIMSDPDNPAAFAPSRGGGAPGVGFSLLILVLVGLAVAQRRRSGRRPAGAA